MKYISIIVIVLFLAASCQLYSQKVDNQKLQYAQSFEQSGDLETAARIYKELFESNPKVQEYFDGVSRTLKALNKYSELLLIVEKYIETWKTVQSYTLYAELLWRTGSNDKANEFWLKAIDLDPVKESTYITVAQSQIVIKQFEKAVSTYESGRSKNSNKNVFADELCQLYIAIGDYKNGTKESLKILSATKNIALAQGRISALMITPESKQFIKSVLEEEINSNSNNYLILKVYAWYLRAIGDFENAFVTYIKMDKMLNVKGREVLGFANDSKTDGQYDIALKAFEYIISLGKDGQYLSSALYGYPRTLEQKMLQNSKLSKESAEKIISYYREIIRQFPDNPASADASFRIAVISVDHLNDLELAKKEIDGISKKFPNSPSYPPAMILLASIYIIEDNIDKALETFTLVANDKRAKSTDEALKAKFNIAEIEFFKGNIDSAQSHYAILLQQAGKDIANDALDRIVLIEQNKDLIAGINLYAKSQLKEKQKKWDDALSMLSECYKKSLGSDLAERSLIRSSEINMELTKYDSALTFSNLLIEEYPKSIFKDKALFIGSDCYAHLNNKDMAIKNLNELILNYPRSIYLQQARDRIRKLRDNL